MTNITRITSLLYKDVTHWRLSRPLRVGVVPLGAPFIYDCAMCGDINGDRTPILRAPALHLDSERMLIGQIRNLRVRSPTSV
jgi:hypothetical protein